MGGLFGWYVRHARLLGALFCLVPTAIWFSVVVAVNPFREVYLVRLAISVIIGGYLAARANEYGIRLWLAKHRSPEGPATVADGAIMGAFVGLATSLLPPLTGLIASHHLEEAMIYVIASWLFALFNGCWVGALVARSGIKHPSPIPDPKGSA